MATAATAKSNPAPAAPSVAEAAHATISSMKTGHDFFRPFRYAGMFINGAVGQTLYGIEFGGRRGSQIGMAAGLLLGFVNQAIFAGLVLGGIGGFVVGAAALATYGAITGGYKEVARQRRGEVYAEDLVQRSKLQSRVPSRRRHSNRADEESARQHESTVRSTQIIERQREIVNDYDTYWREHVTRQHHNHQHQGGMNKAHEKSHVRAYEQEQEHGYERGVGI